MKFNTPLPQPLSKECAKAAKIFQSFVDSRNNGLDGVIPRSVLQRAKGFAIFTVVKAGFVFSARAGSGVVIARLDDGRWSAPSAIGTAGIGFGGQAGAEVTDFLVVLNTRAAIRSFMAAGSLTLGGNLSIALGPLGRNGEAIGSVSSGGKVAAMYSYSKTRGLFGGISIEGSVIVERQDANSQAYKSPVTVKMLLGGHVDPPEWAEPLTKTLDGCTRMPGQRDWIHDEYDRPTDSDYAFGGPNTQPSPPPSTYSRSSSFLKKKKERQSFPPSHWDIDDDRGPSFSGNTSPSTSPGVDTRNVNGFGSSLSRRSTYSHSNPVVAHKTGGTLVDDLDDPFDNAYAVAVASAPVSRGHVPRAASLGGDFRPPSNRSLPAFRSQHSYDAADENDEIFPGPPPSTQQKPANVQPLRITPKPQVNRSSYPGGVARAVALFNFNAVEDGDLSFNKGDVIIITKKSDSTDDWWTGRVNHKEGIFPANFVEVV
ncbi:DUF500-domain-containing protein [Macrolepiota fuliginosa MF-IS2]|uniref:DUF500-domain-containing protein n=1 Tax=Macrolepiota fuliginosa MF-IS2 TaxID=1400762 RepID=A0A9P5XSP1_9AGAR|nr:DUF500-domain-containing protein [Macrolepiota fuliginosa MF-IS2]